MAAVTICSDFGAPPKFWSYPTSEVRGSGRECQAAMVQDRLRGDTPLAEARGGGEEIPHIQGKRNPSKIVRVARGYQRADTLKP